MGEAAGRMRWEKRGLVYAPSGDRWWARSHALLPTPEVLDDVRIRVYYAALDDERYGRIGFVELDSEDPSRVLYETDDPVLNLGERGTFDDSGVNPSALVNVGDEKRLYYIGWQRSRRTPYQLFAGLATSRDGGNTFQRHARVPVLDRIPGEPFLRSATSILHEGAGFRAWYVSALGWTEVRSKLYPKYVIRCAYSNDGVRWSRLEPISIDFETPEEFGFGRPWVLRDPDRYRMWYSIRSRAEPYRLGYAESDDGLHWTRKDGEVGIEASEAGWDSEMICYSSVVDAAGRRYLFYNGNGHGATGFGYAVGAS